MKIRRLSHADAPALRALWAVGLRVLPAAFLLTEQELLATPDDTFADKISSDILLGAYVDEQLQGFVAARRGVPLRLRHTADIGPLYVSQAAQNGGFGRALMNAALDQLCADGVLQVELCVDETNAPAIGLYQSLGFAVFGKRPRSVIIDGRPRQDLLMIKALDGADLGLG